MHPRPDRSLIARLLASRPEPGQVSSLVQRCWPGGSADRTEPVARQWVRSWRPARAAAQIPACSCPRGRCPVCN